MPNYDGTENHQSSWGYGFKKLTDMLAKVVKTHSKNGKVTIV